MKIVLISDTHNKHKHLTSKELPEGDLLIHSGDLTSTGYKGEIESVLKWLKEIASRYTHGVVFIAGNHDRSFDPKFDIEQWSWVQEEIHKLPSNIRYLENSEVVIDGLKIWGSPVTPWFHGDRWAFNVYRGPDIQEVWSNIPKDTDIVVTHGPAAYKLDWIPSQNVYVGCEQLKHRLLEVNPIMHVCGHIHEGYGYEQATGNTHYFNASICDQYYEPNNRPIELEINLETKKLTTNFIL